MVNGIAAVVIAYLLGSISGAYIFTRLLTGKDIRKLGAGVAGARNVYREIGLKAAIPAGIIDVGKGALAVVLADFVLRAPQPYLALVGLAAVAGHIWPVYLKFRGGNGLSTAIGVLAMMLTRELFIIIGIMMVLTVVTRNPVLSLNIGFLSLPVSAWFFEESPLAALFSVFMIAIMVINFIPTARAALAAAGSRQNLIASLVRAGDSKK